MPADGLSAPRFSLVKHSLALPTDPDLDVFASGDDEVDRFFGSRQWFNTDKRKHKPPTYQFVATSGQAVGYAAVDWGNRGHPLDGGAGQAKYLIIYAAGVHTRFHGQSDPNTPGLRYSTAMFQVMEQWAVDKPACVGLYLWVRRTNMRAIAFYRRFGFEDDSGPPVASRPDHLTMRKLVR